MTENDVIKEIKEEFKEHFPNLPIAENKEQYDNFKNILLAFILPFQKDEMFIYLNNRDESIGIPLHIANIPQGIEYFENWFQYGLFSFATGILDALKQTLPKEKVYLSFAQFLDNKDFNTFVKKSKFSKEDEEKVGNLFLPMLTDPEFEQLMQAMSCIYVGLNNSAKSLLRLWIQSLWFDGADIQKVIDEAKAIVTIKKQSSMAGKKGSSKRWGNRDKTLKFALQLAREGNYKNNNQAAAAITERVFDFGRAVGFNFSSQFQANSTIYKWLNTSKNE